MSYQLTPREELEVALRREAQERFTSYGPYSSLPNYDDVLNADHACGCLFEHGSWALRIYCLVGLILFFGAPELFVFAILVVAAVEKTSGVHNECGSNGVYGPVLAFEMALGLFKMLFFAFPNFTMDGYINHVISFAPIYIGAAVATVAFVVMDILGLRRAREVVDSRLVDI